MKAKVAAERMGYRQVKGTSHGQAVFYNGVQYITRDVTGHNGGAWKAAKSVKNLASKETRTGTLDKNLKRIGD